MTLEQRFKKVMGETLSCPARAELITAIDQKTRSFSELQKISNITSGTLGYHLLKAQAAGIIERNAEEKYAITPLGNKVATILKQINDSWKQ